MPTANRAEVRPAGPDSVRIAFWHENGDTRECLAVVEMTAEAEEELFHDLADSPDSLAVVGGPFEVPQH